MVSIEAGAVHNDPDDAASLLEYIADLISSHIDGEVVPRLISSWLAQYPWLLVLDGLDEVPHSSNREQVMTAIRDFWVETAQGNADCMVIATSRPQGYNEDFSPRYYRHFWLSPLSSTRALHYGNLLLKVRFKEQGDRREDITRRLRRAAAQVETARLMTSPLQVTIMATLLERMGKPPEGRWNLFSRYYEVIYDREVEREIPAASILREYRPDITAIHQRVGLVLQAESETTEQSAPQMSLTSFAEIVRQRLCEEEHEVDDESLVQQIIESATHRLVFLVGVQEDQVGFEIRSLQEFMAAEALLDGKDVVFERRLRAIAPRASWRNVFLFAAGRCFADLQHLRDTIHTICVELNDEAVLPLASVFFPGSILALDLLADGVAYRQPRYERMLAREALRIVRRPPSSINNQLAEVYQPSLRLTYEAELRTALGSEDFEAALPAWRTLAVLGGRGEDWAFDLLESRMPPSGHLDDLLATLAHIPPSERLSKKLAALCVESAPGDSLGQSEAIHALGILDFSPRWYQVFVALVAERHRRSPGGEFRFEGISERELQSDVFQITDAFSLIESAIVEISDEELEEMPASWSVPAAMIRFAKRPTAANLAEQLEQISASDESGEWLRVCAANASWPLGALLTSRGGLRDLKKTAQLARDGAFGDREQWKAAERRWRSRRVRKSDMRHPDDWEYPFDEKISAVGFPLLAAQTKVSRTGSKASVLLDFLREANDSPTKASLVDTFFRMLAGLVAGGSGAPDLSATELMEVIDGDTAAGNFTFPLSALDGLSWGASPEREINFLNILGNRRLNGRVLGSQRLNSKLRHILLAAWQADRGRTGIYRLLAICWPAQPSTSSGVTTLLEAEANAGTSAARALLRLKLGEMPTDADLAALANSGEGYWLEAAIGILSGWPDADLLETSLRKLDAELTPKHWRAGGELSSLAAEVNSRHASGLAGHEQWHALRLFERPSAKAL